MLGSARAAASGGSAGVQAEPTGRGEEGIDPLPRRGRGTGRDGNAAEGGTALQRDLLDALVEGPDGELVFIECEGVAEKTLRKHADREERRRGEVELGSADRGADKGVGRRHGNRLDLVVRQTGAGVGVVDCAGMDVEDARVARTDEERRGVDGGQCRNLERCRVYPGEGKPKRHKRGPVVDENAAAARAKQDVSGG